MQKSKNEYDVIVIGGGASGLAAAARLARAGRKTLLLEKENHLGGQFAPLAHEAYRFDVGARLLMGCNTDGPYGPGPIHAFLEQIGALDKVEFIPLQPFLGMNFPDSRFPYYSGRAQFIEGLQQAAPRGLERLPELLDLCGRLYRQSQVYVRRDLPWTTARALLEMPGMALYANTTLERVLSSYFPDPRARGVMGAMWPYMGVPPAQCSFLSWALLLCTYIDEGAYYCRGSLGSLAEAIAEAYTQAGGELQLGKAVRRVLVKQRRVTGVETAEGERFFAPAVISTVDPRLVFGPMMDPAESPGFYRRRLARMTASNTGISLSFVTDLDLAGMGFHFENLFFDSWDEMTDNRTPLTGQAGFFSLTISSLADPGLTPSGQHSVSAFTALAEQTPLGPDDVRKYGLVLQKVVEQHVPGLAGHLLLEGDTGDGYFTRPCAPVYGWAITPWQASLGRLDLKTPVRGLQVAGHWARPMHGVMPAILSGWQAARIILADT